MTEKLKLDIPIVLPGVADAADGCVARLMSSLAGRPGVETVHVGLCTKNKEGVRCKNVARIMEMLEEEGIEVVDGTH